jgi:hypothetical protein
VAEAQRLIEAGETPTIKDCMRVVEQEPGQARWWFSRRASGHGCGAATVSQ